MAGGVSTNSIAKWDGIAWAALGSGLGGAVEALATLPNGDLVAGGSFSVAGGVGALNVAKWDGSAWSPLGSGLNGAVMAVAVLPNGDLVAGGLFTMAGATSVSHIARWNGSMWTPLGLGVGGAVATLAVLPNGDIVAGGSFATAGSASASRVARWNGSAWSPMGSQGAATNGDVLALAVLPNDDLVACGQFTQIAGVNARGIARWGGSLWSPLGSGMEKAVESLAVLPDGTLAAGGGFFTAGGQPSAYFARYVPTCQAEVEVYGSDCPANYSLVATSLPWSGSTFRSIGVGLPTSAIILAVTGFGEVVQQLPSSPLACNLLASTDVVDWLGNSNGIAHYGLVLPNGPAIAGILLYHQMVAVETGPLTMTSTNGLKATIGSL